MLDLIYGILILIALASIGVRGLKLEKILSQEEYLDRLNGLRGLFAIEVVIGHVVRYV